MTRVAALHTGQYSFLTKVFTDEELMHTVCPGGLLMGESKIDNETRKESIDGKIYGCRGISCQECWNQEVYKEDRK